MPRSYVNNAYNRRLGRVGMPLGSMPVSSPKTYVGNSYNQSVGREGLKHGTALISKSSSQSPSVKVDVDNVFNRALGRVGMPLGSMTVSSEKSSTKTGSPVKRKESYITINIRVLVKGYCERPICISEYPLLNRNLSR
ncbi:hypothetical protein KP79_PYT24377 [Mizuhopecten yessoensis]|uniref:Uncharacterized protein n=1 Tax=Mizuhopecten yessoensis TaxID=6573 RepID=A0A210QS55_MIZYE|nr:hypothetical protein KP79_PYT24377 [Mizuhopecten yessoensis]